MSNPSSAPRSLLRPHGVAGPARVRAFQGSGAPELLRGSGAVIGGVLAVAVLAFAPGVAQAAQTRELVRSFGSGELSLVAPTAEPKTAGSGLAIDQATGDVYVADTGNHRVSEFEANGTFIRAFGKNVGGLGVDVCGGLVSCEAGTEGSEPGELTTPVFVAVDNDPTSASFGDVYVADTADNLVSKFSEEGNLVASWGTGGQLNGSTAPDGPLDGIDGVAVNGNGNLLVITGTAENDRNQVFRFAQDGSSPVDFPTTRVMAPNALAVDPAGNLFKVNGDGSVEKLKAGGEDVGTVTRDTEPPAPPVSSAIAIEPSSGDLFVANAAGSIDHYAFNGSGQVIEPEGPPCTPESSKGCPSPSDSTSTGFAPSGIAVSDAAGAPGDTYVANPSTGEVSQYGPLVTVPDVVTGPAEHVGPTSATLTGAVNPDKVLVTTCEFEYVSDATLRVATGRDYQELIEGGTFTPEFIFSHVGVHAPCEEPDGGEVGEGTEPVGVHANLTGLEEGGTYHYRLKGENANGSSIAAVLAFTTATPPAIEAATAINITESSATLDAKVNPDNGELKSCSFEYGTSTEYGTVVPCTPSLAQTGSGGTPVPITVAIAKLEHNRTYHWTVVAKNAAGTNAKVDHTFIDDTEGAGALPDKRQYELVSTTRKNGALIDNLSAVISHGDPYSIAPDGSRLFSEAIQCFAGASSCNPTTGNLLGNVYEFTRTSAGWVTEPLTPAAGSGLSSGAYWSADATSGAVLFTIPTEPFGEDDFYVREPESGRFLDIGPNTPPQAGAQGPVGGFDVAEGVAVTPDLSHVVWETTARWPFDERTGVGGASPSKGVYEYAGVANKEPLQVGVSGGYDEAKNHSLISACEDTLTTHDGSPGEISEDGKTVFFTALTKETGPCESGTGKNTGKEVRADTVYARVDGELPDAHTVAISEPSEREVGGAETVVPAAPYPGCEKEPCIKNVNEKVNFADAHFVGASKDGSKAFFLSPQQLTDQASEDAGEPHAAKGFKDCSETVEPGGCNLYEYEGVTAQDPAGEGALLDVSAGEGGSSVPGGPRVQGVFASSPEGNHVYFVAKGVLTTAPSPDARGLGPLGEPVASGAVAQEGANNLYVYSDQTHRVSFIAALPDSDKGAWAGQEGNTADVTPNGQFLVFLSHGDLTSDDTSLSGASQVFRYDAGSGGAGSLTRISIGEEGFDDDGNRSTATPCKPGSEGQACSEDARVVPPNLKRWEFGPTMSDDAARVFFTSPVGLAPGALDDLPIGEGNPGEPIYAQNVYEWEQAGVGSCPAGQSSGCVYLISDGRDVNHDNAPVLLGTDEKGNNVFFGTTDQLRSSDNNNEFNIYDARVCEPESPCIAEPPPPLPPCLGEACHGIPPARSPVTAGPTATFNGAGNLAPPPVKPAPRALTRAQKLGNALGSCRKKYKKSKKRRAACEKSAHQKYGAKTKAKKATNNGRTK